MQRTLPQRVVDQMMEGDHFSQWLDIQRLGDEEGANTLSLTVRREMLNGFGILHGGITFALADSALAFAANSHGTQCLSIENSIHYHAQVMEGETIIARAEEVSKSNKVAVYVVEIRKENKELVSTFKGTVYRTSRDWFPSEKEK